MRTGAHRFAARVRKAISFAAVMLIASMAMPAMAGPPAVSVLTAELTDPTTADTWYNQFGSTHTPRLCELIPSSDICTTGRPAEIRELARTLGAGRFVPEAYADRVFEYVFANIDTEFRYGVSKGALGAVLDQSGTAFDQAYLMVELLKEGNVPATYEAGTITLDGTQFSNWTGITSALVACRLLADGGIPAIINGTVNANCSYGSATVSSVTLAHIWVVTETKRYDPAYKKFNFKAPINIGTATGCDSACATTVTTAAIPSGPSFDSAANANFVQDVQTAALASQLKTYGTNLENYIRNNTTRVAWAVEDLVGGRAVDLAALPGTTSALPYPSSVQHTWPEIPNQYRSRLRVQFDNIDEWLYADEITGYWLTIAGGGESQQQATTRRYSELHIWGRNLAPIVLKTSQRDNASWTTSVLTLSVDHPYYAMGTGGTIPGGYMDEVAAQSILMTQAVGGGSGVGTLYLFMPALIAHGWGRTGPGHLSKVERDAAGVFFDNTTGGILPCTGTMVFCDRIHDGAFQVYADGWLTQASEGMRLVDGINRTRTEHHHTFGIVANISGLTFLDARSSLSLTGVTNNAGNRQAARASQIALLSTMEGSVAEQQNDSWGSSSAISLMGLANEKSHRFYEVNSTNVDQVLNTTDLNAGDRSFVHSYVDAQYSAIVPNHNLITGFTWGNWQSVFQAPLLAFSNDDTRQAYISVGRMKGGGSGTAPYDEVMKSVLVVDPKLARKRVNYAVDLSTGTLTYATPPVLETGSGGFPYSLPFQYFFKSGIKNPPSGYWLQDPLYGIFVFVPDPLNAGNDSLRHNYEVEARISNDGMQALGVDSALDASATVAALYVMRMLNTGTQTFSSRVTGTFVMDWFAKQLVDNAVVVTRPPDTLTFQRLPSGAYNPPPGTAEILERSGTSANPTGARQRAMLGLPNFNYADIILTLTDKDGAVITFTSHDWAVGPSQPTLYVSKLKADSWVYPDGARVDFTYTPGQALPAGNNPQIKFRTALASVSNNLGRRLDFGGTNTVTDENSRSANLTEDGLRDSSGALWQYSLGGMTSPSGVNVFKVLYDSLGRVRSITDGDDRLTEYFPGKVSTEAFARGESANELNELTTVFFDRGNHPIQGVDPVGRVTSNIYDGIGRLKSTLYPEGNSVGYTYDVRSNLLTETRKQKAAGTATLVTTNTYFTNATTAVCPATETKRCNKITRVNGPRTDVNDITNFTYNQATGQVATKTGAAVTGGSPLTTYGYESRAGTTGSISMLTSKTERITTSRNTIARFDYDPAAAHLTLKSVTADSGGLNLLTQIVYDAVGNVTSITDPRGKVSWYCWDAGRRLIRNTRQMGTRDQDCSAAPTPTGDDIVTVYEYNTDGNLYRQRAKHAEFSTWRDTTYAYLPSWALDTVTDPELNVTNYDYDPAGRVAMVTDPAGRKTRTFYYPDGKVRKVLKGYQFSATSTNEACSIPDTDQQCYLRNFYAPGVQDPRNYNGQLYAVQDANGNFTTYAYDLFDRRDTTTFADTSFDFFVYDQAGNAGTFRNRANETITNTWDALNRLTGKSHTSFPAVTYGYDLLSRRTSVTQTGGQAVSWVIDNAGRIESTTAGSRTLGFKYDGAGNRTRVTWPDTSFFIEYTYDDANRIDLVKENDVQVLADYSYDTLSHRTGIARGNGHSTTFAYEPDDDLSSITHAGLPTTPTFGFLYNPAHQMRQMTVSDNALLAVPLPSAPTVYSPNSLNQYGSVNGVTFAYDPKGNLTGDGQGTYAYDAENRLLTATVDGTTATYTYDGLGRRIRKALSTGVSTDFLLDGDEEVAEYDGITGALMRRYVYGTRLDDRILSYEGTGTAAADERYYYGNHQGSTIVIADGNGAVTESVTYDAYGQSSATTGNPFRFTGRRFDLETGLYYYRARYYSPKLGRFLQTDPIGMEQELNLYAYVRNDPLNATDPSGKELDFDIWEGIVRAFQNMFGKKDPPPANKPPRGNGNAGDQDQGGEITIEQQSAPITFGSDEVATPGSTVNRPALPGEAKLDPAGLNLITPITEVQKELITDTVNAILNGGSSYSVTEHYDNHPNKVTGAQLPTGYSYFSITVPDPSVSNRGTLRLMVGVAPGKQTVFFATVNHYASFYGLFTESAD